MKKKNKGFLGRLLGRSRAEAQECPYVCHEGMWYRQEWRDGSCAPIGEPLGPCPLEPEEMDAGAKPNSDDASRSEPPLICWKGQLYRQKWVDGGMEAYGEPLGPC